MQTAGDTNSASSWEVRRHIKIPTLSQAADAAAVVGTIGELPGVHSVTTDLDRRQVVVDYDASQSSYQEIEQTLKDAGIPPANSWWDRIKGGWYQYTDENARDNAKAPPPSCCNKPPR